MVMPAMSIICIVIVSVQSGYNVSGSPDFYLVVSSVAALQEVIIQRSWAVAAQVSLK